MSYNKPRKYFISTTNSRINSRDDIETIKYEKNIGLIFINFYLGLNEIHSFNSIKKL